MLLHGILCTTYLLQHRSKSTSLLSEQNKSNGSRQGRSRRKDCPGCRHHRGRCRQFDHPDLPRSLPTSADALPDDDSIYSPMTPVRVHLHRDEELAPEKSAEHSPVTPSQPVPEGHSHQEDCTASDQVQATDEANSVNVTVKPPPPAYGLWRCSVRADPNLLHWRRVSDADPQGGRAESRQASPVTTQSTGTPSRQGGGETRPPPSYVTLQAAPQPGVPLRDEENVEDEEAGEWPLRADEGMVLQDESDVISHHAPTQAGTGPETATTAVTGHEQSREPERRQSHGSLQGLTRALLRRSVME